MHETYVYDRTGLLMINYAMALTASTTFKLDYHLKAFTTLTMKPSAVSAAARIDLLMFQVS